MMGQVHEIGSLALYAQMDVYNNELGIQIASGDETLKNAILTAILNGNVR